MNLLQKSIACCITCSTNLSTAGIGSFMVKKVNVQEDPQGGCIFKTSFPEVFLTFVNNNKPYAVLQAVQQSQACWTQ